MDTKPSGAGWTTALVKQVLNDGGMLTPFNEAYLKIMRRRPVQALSNDPLNRFFQEGATPLTSPTLVPFDVGQQAIAEIGAAPAGDAHQMYGRSFKVLARFAGDHHVNLANSFMAAHPGSSLLAEVDGQAIIASSEDSGTPIKAP